MAVLFLTSKRDYQIKRKLSIDLVSFRLMGIGQLDTYVQYRVPLSVCVRCSCTDLPGLGILPLSKPPTALTSSLPSSHLHSSLSLLSQPLLHPGYLDLSLNIPLVLSVRSNNTS
jgi:hypothetical protein